jgi:hypothetical protein
MESVVSLPCSKQPAIGLYPEPDKSTSHQHFQLLEIFNRGPGELIRFVEVKFLAEATLLLLAPRSRHSAVPFSLLSMGIFPRE